MFYIHIKESQKTFFFLACCGKRKYSCLRAGCAFFDAWQINVSWHIEEHDGSVSVAMRKTKVCILVHGAGFARAWWTSCKHSHLFEGQVLNGSARKNEGVKLHALDLAEALVVFLYCMQARVKVRITEEKYRSQAQKKEVHIHKDFRGLARDLTVFGRRVLAHVVIWNDESHVGHDW
jgi:hypothetical protein